MVDQLEEKNRIARELLNKEIEITDEFYVPRLETYVNINIRLEIVEPEEFMDLLEVDDYSEYTGETFIDQVISSNVLIGIQNYEMYGLDVYLN